MTRSGIRTGRLQSCLEFSPFTPLSPSCGAPAFSRGPFSWLLVDALVDGFFHGVAAAINESFIDAFNGQRGGPDVDSQLESDGTKRARRPEVDLEYPGV